MVFPRSPSWEPSVAHCRTAPGGTADTPWPGICAHLDLLPGACSALSAPSPGHPYITGPPSSVPQGMYLPPSHPGSEPLPEPPLTFAGCISLSPGDLQGLTGVSVTWCLGQGWAPRGSSSTNRTASTAPIGHTTLFCSTHSRLLLLTKALCRALRPGPSMTQARSPWGQRGSPAERAWGLTPLRPCRATRTRPFPSLGLGLCSGRESGHRASRPPPRIWGLTAQVLGAGATPEKPRPWRLEGPPCPPCSMPTAHLDRTHGSCSPEPPARPGTRRGPSTCSLD